MTSNQDSEIYRRLEAALKSGETIAKSYKYRGKPRMAIKCETCGRMCGSIRSDLTGFAEKFFKEITDGHILQHHNGISSGVVFEFGYITNTDDNSGIQKVVRES